MGTFLQLIILRGFTGSHATQKEIFWGHTEMDGSDGTRRAPALCLQGRLSQPGFQRPHSLVRTD